MAAAAAVSCGKTEESAPVATGHKVTLQAGIELPADTKAYVADNDGSGKGAFTWAAGDRIAVYTSDGKFTAFTIDNADAGKASAKFSAELPEGVTAVGPALYPYSDAHVNNLDGTVQYNMPTQRDWYNRAVYCPMAAAWTGTGAIEFKQIGGVICVPFEDLSSTAQEFTFTSNNSRITGIETNAGASRNIDSTNGLYIFICQLDGKPLTLQYSVSFAVSFFIIAIADIHLTVITAKSCISKRACDLLL